MTRVGGVRPDEAEVAYEQELLVGSVTDVLNAVLHALGLSQKELARRLGVTEGRVSQVLSGSRGLTLNTLAAVGAATGVRFDLVPRPVGDLEPEQLERLAWMRRLAEVVHNEPLASFDGAEAGANASSGRLVPADSQPPETGVGRGTAERASIRTIPTGSAWENRHGDRTISTHRSKEAAVRRGRELARDLKSDHVIHHRDGRIARQDSYAGDPLPPKGGALSKEQRHVVREGKDWVVKKPGAERASSRHETQREADQRAAEILRNAGGGERLTHGRDGKIRSKDTISPARDPNPPRDKEH